jgi:putative N6-adenine-specific DNA methylase
MCGSGTIPIEAALIAAAIPPGRFRKSYGFQRWKDFSSGLFEKVKNESDTGILSPSVRISGSDISESALLQARINVESAGLSNLISIEKNYFSDLKAAGEDGYIIMNPPYGQRLKPSDIEGLYSMIGTTMKHNFPGYNAFLITSDKDYLRYIGLKPSKKIPLYNGSLQCSLVKYELYQGSRKKIL